MSTNYIKNQEVSFEDFKNSILEDYRLARTSREMSMLARREVLTGKAKFGIVGDGKELPQIAMAKVFRNGDWRSGYYRDQTFALAIGAISPRSYFAQLYADTHVEREPASAGRQMNCHFATRFLDENGEWKNQTESKNISSDISPTAGQMPRLLGLAQASSLYKKLDIPGAEIFSNKGNEVAFGTIGDASTAEGHFFETLNAACALQVPMIVSIWDDGYGISVPTDKQRAKADISEMLSGFERKDGQNEGCEIISVRAWDYPALLSAYANADAIARAEHIPVVVHVKEVTQPQGHSTSGSHERYKDEIRMSFESEFDGLVKFRQWILDYRLKVGEQEEIIASEFELSAIDSDAKKQVKSEQKAAFEAYEESLQMVKNKFSSALENCSTINSSAEEIVKAYKNQSATTKRDVFHAARQLLLFTAGDTSADRKQLQTVLQEAMEVENDNYSSHLHSESLYSPLQVQPIAIEYKDNAEDVDGRIVVRNNFDKILEKYPQVVIFGEDTGKIGDVNQGLEGLQEKYGELRIADTGIREATILGQGIGLAMRGLRPIAEIQYLDYVLYCLQGMSDDLATLQYRTKGGQKAPLIIRTRGHRLEGIWHSGSPMAGILNNIKGVHFLVPRDLTRAAGFYNTLLKGDDPAIVVECLNGYRLKEKEPANYGDFCFPLGKIEVTKEGSDITLVTYGSTWRLVMQAAIVLENLGIHAEVIDIQSLMPFDLSHEIVESVAKTNRLAIIDEDVEGGASAYILQHILEKQGGYAHLDSAPITITSKNHRPAYASDGDYFSKPSVDDMVERIYTVFNDANPKRFPAL